MAAATSPWRAPASSFSADTAETGIGAITRSSISRLYPNSCTSGRATAWIPWKMHAIAMTPGTRRLEKFVSPSAPPPIPCPIFGNTYVNTNTNSNGCMIVRSANSMNDFLRTFRSRSSSAPNAMVGVLRWGLTRGRVTGAAVSTFIPEAPFP